MPAPQFAMPRSNVVFEFLFDQAYEHHRHGNLERGLGDLFLVFAIPLTVPEKQRALHAKGLLEQTYQYAFGKPYEFPHPRYLALCSRVNGISFSGDDGALR